MTTISPRRRPATALAAALLAAALLAGACGSSTSDVPVNAAAAEPDEVPSTSAAASAGTAPSPAQPDLVETRPAVLQLARTQLDGAVFDPDSVAGRNVLLWFWAPW
ncbi:MAG TPA: hypothetical protein DEP69_04005 [Acidimicrobiaceae bacterium]|nr:hypothetical protein [Acidimicrobiaceae bacterium]